MGDLGGHKSKSNEAISYIGCDRIDDEWEIVLGARREDEEDARDGRVELDDDGDHQERLSREALRIHRDVPISHHRSQ